MELVHDSVLEPANIAEDIPPPRPTDEVPEASPVKVGIPLTRSAPEEGEIPQSEPSAHQQEIPATTSVLDPLVTEHATADKNDAPASTRLVHAEHQPWDDNTPTEQ